MLMTGRWLAEDICEKVHDNLLFIGNGEFRFCRDAPESTMAQLLQILAMEETDLQCKGAGGCAHFRFKGLKVVGTNVAESKSWGKANIDAVHDSGGPYVRF